jgi:hypothetical protein
MNNSDSEFVSGYISVRLQSFSLSEASPTYLIRIYLVSPVYVREGMNPVHFCSYPPLEWPRLTFTLSSNLPRQTYHRHHCELHLAKIHSKPTFCFALASCASSVASRCSCMFPPLRASFPQTLSSPTSRKWVPCFVHSWLPSSCSTWHRLQAAFSSLQHHISPFLVQLLKASMQNMRLY